MAPLADQHSRDVQWPEQDGWVQVRPSGFTRLVGPIWTRVADGHPRFAFIVVEKHDNTEERAHGGMIMSFCDEALGLTARGNRPGMKLLTISFECQFVDAAKMGDFVEIDTDVVRASRSLTFMRGTCRAGGRIIATCSGVWKVVHERPGFASGDAREKNA